MSQKTSSAPRVPMTTEAAARIQSATARTNGGQVQAGTFAARAQSAAARHAGTGSGKK